ncbi:MAG: hypothetical protein GH155_01705 [Spirochaeta sp.]|nr:hypothetical protein [Spirochaeta sp.]
MIRHRRFLLRFFLFFLIAAIFLSCSRSEEEISQAPASQEAEIAAGDAAAEEPSPAVEVPGAEPAPEAEEAAAPAETAEPAAVEPAAAEPAVIAAGTPEQPESGPPSITITSPPDSGYYYLTVLVEGKVKEARHIKSLTWVIPGTTLGGNVPFKENGYFRYLVSTSGLRGNHTLTLTAVSKSGLTSEKSHSLRYHSPLPTVTVAPAAEKKDDKAAAALHIPVRKPAPKVQPENDPLGPLIFIVSPENNSFYKSQVTVVGRLGNSEQDPDSALEVALLSYSLDSDPSRSGEIEFDAKNGTFSIDFPVNNLEGRQSLLFTSEHRNGQNSYFTLTMQDGNVQPQLTILTPEEQSQYGAWVKVSGLLTEASGRSADAETIKSLSYLVSSSERFDAESEIKGELSFNADYTFDFFFPAQDLTGPQTVTVTAESWNGNRAEEAITLQKGESDIPTFSVAAGDQQATMAWDPIPLDALYSIYHTNSSASETELELRQYQPPVVVKGLDNGRLYNFRLKAEIPDTGKEYWSNYRKSIPLSPNTLKPTVKGDYERIIVSWQSIPGSGEYEVWRSIDNEDNYQNISGTIANTVFNDTEVRYGREYYYRIKPGIPGSLSSSASPARTLAFPLQKLSAGAINREVTEPVNVAMKGDYAFVAAGANGLNIVDIADPANPRMLAALTTTDARAVDCRDNYVYLADGSRGVKIIDISEPGKPVQVGARKTFAAQDLKLRGNYLYVADGEKGLKVLNISDPRYPVRVFSFDTFNALSLTLREDYIYLADGDQGLKIFDISDPLQPRLTASISQFKALAVDISHNFACVAAADQGIIIIDISNPLNPVRISSYDTNNALDVTVSCDYAFVADGRWGIKVIDLADPSQPMEFASLPGVEALSLAVSDDLAYVANSSGLRVVNILIQGNSQEIASCSSGERAYDLELSGNFAYIAGHQQGLQIIDISDPRSVNDDSLVAASETLYASDLAVRGSHAFIADGKAGFKIFDVSPAQDGSNNNQPQLIASADSGNNTRGIAVQDNFAFLADENTGLQIFDISDPAHPMRVASAANINPRDVAVAGSHAFAIGADGLKVIDIADPAEPRIAATYESGPGSALELSGNTAYLVTSSGLLLLDVSEPLKPVRSHLYASKQGEDVCIDDNYAYLAEGYKGLTILDISDPANPIKVSSCPDVYAVGVEVRDRYAFVVDSFGLKVIDILIPPWLIK